MLAAAILDSPVSDRGTLQDLSQSAISGRSRGCKSLIPKGEMAEWSMAHAWKLMPVARADAHRNAPTHSRSTTSSNNGVHQSVAANHGVWPGFQRASDTLLTQNIVRLTGRGRIPPVLACEMRARKDCGVTSYLSSLHYDAARIRREPGNCGLCTATPKAGSRSPQWLGQLAIPLLPQITELLYLVRTLGGAIPRLADIFREIVETGFREIT
jgi:hypothetical protein